MIIAPTIEKMIGESGMFRRIHDAGILWSSYGKARFESVLKVAETVRTGIRNDACLLVRRFLHIFGEKIPGFPAFGKEDGNMNPGFEFVTDLIVPAQNEDIGI